MELFPFFVPFLPDLCGKRVIREANKLSNIRSKYSKLAKNFKTFETVLGRNYERANIS